jgi:hypothetical protein
MRKIVAAIVAIATLALVSAASLGVGSAKEAQAATWVIEGFATGAEEVPAVSTPGRASVRFVYNDVTNTLTFAVTQSGFSADQVTAAHIHRGARGVNGPIVHDLSTTGFVQVAGTINLSPANVADLRAGNYYFNIHSKEHPGGYARMQLMLPAAALGAIPGGFGPGAPGGPGGPAGPGGPVILRPPSTGDGGILGSSDALLPLLGVLAFATGGTAVLALARRSR